jgi:hypothetical protein
VVLLRRGPFGRRLQAMKDSPAACATLGLNLTVTKMQVFVLSAAIAGLGGAMLASVQGQAQIDDYNALQSLPILLMAVAGGIAMVSGALFGGLVYASFQILTKHIPDIEVIGMQGKELVADLLLLAPALIGVSLGRNPNGAVAEISLRARAAYERMRLPRAERVAEPSPDSLVQTVDFELLGIDRPFTEADLAVIDRALSLDEGAEAGPLRPAAAAAWDPGGNPVPGRLYEEVRAGGAARG